MTTSVTAPAAAAAHSHVFADAEDIDPALLALTDNRGQPLTKDTPLSRLRVCYPNVHHDGKLEPLAVTLRAAVMKKGLELYSGSAFAVKANRVYTHGEAAFKKVAQAKLSGRLEVARGDDQWAALCAINALVAHTIAARGTAEAPPPEYRELIDLFGNVGFTTRAFVHGRDGKRVAVDDAKKHGVVWSLESTDVVNEDGEAYQDPFAEMADGFAVTQGTFTFVVSEHNGKLKLELEASRLEGQSEAYTPPPRDALPHAADAPAECRVPKRQRTAEAQ